jgi:hypothetical protein
MCFRPDLFTVTARNPGSLQISRMNANIGRFVSGDFVPAAPTPFTTRSLGKYVMRSVESTDLWRRHGTLYWHYYRDALEVLLAESASRGHGATVVLLPSGGAAIPEKLILATYRLEADVHLISHFEEVLTYGSGLVPEGNVYHSMIKFFVLDVLLRQVVAVSSNPAPDSAFAPPFFGRPSGQLP